jgi:hypothetical protein
MMRSQAVIQASAGIPAASKEIGLAKGSKMDAEVNYANAQKRVEKAPKVPTEVQAEAKRISDNTALLKGLRLAKEAADLAAKPATPGASKPKARAKWTPAEKPNADNEE